MTPDILKEWEAEAREDKEAFEASGLFCIRVRRILLLIQAIQFANDVFEDMGSCADSEIVRAFCRSSRGHIQEILKGEG